ncbi:MAG: polyamine aminopropyltransferase [Candidatus Comchoanobacterales bacterium]
MSKEVCREKLYEGYYQVYDSDNVIFEKKSEHQSLVIFESNVYGRVLALDNVVQCTEKDQYMYAEMMAHVPLFSHPCPRNVLIIGGGDGAVLREVLKHKLVKKVTMVEIDESVITLCREYFPSLSGNAFDDPRLNIVIDDGMNFLKRTYHGYDVILVDSTDPNDIADSLFSEEFYHACQGQLKANGILVTQNSVSLLQQDNVKRTHQRMQSVFKHNGFYLVNVPSYIGGFMCLAWASDHDLSKSHTSVNYNMGLNPIESFYYNEAIHKSSFVWPEYMNRLLDIKTKGE